jgi:hypothetical protein
MFTLLKFMKLIIETSKPLNILIESYTIVDLDKEFSRKLLFPSTFSFVASPTLPPRLHS